MKCYAVPEGLINAILNYLGKRPYVEVVPLINGLAHLKEVPPSPLAVVPKDGQVS